MKGTKVNKMCLLIIINTDSMHLKLTLARKLKDIYNKNSQKCAWFLPIADHCNLFAKW